MARFQSPEQLLEAALKARDAGYSRLDAYSTLPIEGLSEAVGLESTRLPLIVLISGILGGIGGFALQYWISVIDFPLNVGGRPFNSWPSFVPIMFETTVLCAALGAVVGMLALNGLPSPYHPVFNMPQFRLASRHPFFLCIKARDPKFEVEAAKRFLMELQPYEVWEIED